MADFKKSGSISKEKLEKIIKTKKELENIPVVYGVDFGHTTPHITFPIGGKARLISKKDDVRLDIITH